MHHFYKFIWLLDSKDLSPSVAVITHKAVGGGGSGLYCGQHHLQHLAGCCALIFSNLLLNPKISHTHTLGAITQRVFGAVGGLG